MFERHGLSRSLFLGTRPPTIRPHSHLSSRAGTHSHSLEPMWSEVQRSRSHRPPESRQGERGANRLIFLFRFFKRLRQTVEALVFWMKQLILDILDFGRFEWQTMASHGTPQSILNLLTRQRSFKSTPFSSPNPPAHSITFSSNLYSPSTPVQCLALLVVLL